MSNPLTTINLLLGAQEVLNGLDAERAEEYDNLLHANEYRSRLLFADLRNGLEIEYYGEVWDEAWEIFLNTITVPEIASRLTSLRITGPDEGANGCRTHDFQPLLDTNVHFPRLLNLYIRPTDVTNHNIVEIADNQIPLLIARCPKLNSLTLPNPPEPDFFDCGLPDLYYLCIGMAWRTHRFIHNMANSHNMPALIHMDFTDSLSVFNQANIQPANSDFDDSYTTFEDYLRLIESKTIKPNMVMHLRNAMLTKAQFETLNKVKPLQLSASLSAPHVYISHWDKRFNTPFEHLIFSA